MKRISLSVLSIIVLAILIINNAISSIAAVESKRELPIVVYGEDLSESQKSEVSELLTVAQHDQVDEFTVNGKDIAKYIGGDPNSNMYSSVKIIPREHGEGLFIDIVTPTNITQVTKEMYMNALLTAGVENAKVVVASSVQVSGHSALTGIYKAYDAKGVKLDEGRMQAASDELEVATSISEEEGLDKDEISKLLTEIKKAIAEQEPINREEVERIIQEQLQSLNIELSPENRQRLIDLFEQMRHLDIDFDQVRNQLNDLTGSLQEFINNDGFWNRIKTGLQDFFHSLTKFINSLLNET